MSIINVTKHEKRDNVFADSMMAAMGEDGALRLRLFSPDASHGPLVTLEHPLPDLKHRDHTLLYLLSPSGHYAVTSYQRLSDRPVIATANMQLPALASLLGAVQRPGLGLIPGQFAALPLLFGASGLLRGLADASGLSPSEFEWLVKEYERRIEMYEWKIFAAKIGLGIGGAGIIAGGVAGNPVMGGGGLVMGFLSYGVLLDAQKDLQKLKSELENIIHNRNTSRSTKGSSSSGSSRSKDSHASGESSGGSSSGGSTASSGSGHEHADREPSKPNDDCTGVARDNGGTEVICRDSAYPNPEGSDPGNPRSYVGASAYPNPEGSDPGNPHSYGWTIVATGNLGIGLHQGIALNVRTYAK